MSLRDSSVQMSSIALVDGRRMQGLWHEVAGYPRVSGCKPATVGLTIEITGSDCFLPVPRKGASLVVSGPGRLTTGDGTELWILWVDADYRTLVIGDPQGRFGAILNREVIISEDRLTAAKRVLEWNGYRLSGLVTAN
ncbi:MAG: lipocalin family protein [Deltaproteobacteria bacterium]